MKITLDIVQAKDAADDHIEWLRHHFPEGVEYQALLDQLAGDEHESVVGLGYWLLNQFGGDNTARLEIDGDLIAKHVLAAGHLHVRGNIIAELGISVGNDIRSASICAGSCVEAGGDIEIESSLLCEEGVYAKGGIWAGADIRAGWDIKALNISADHGGSITAGDDIVAIDGTLCTDGDITSGGNIVTSNWDVSCGGDLKAAGCLLIGGAIVASGDIVAGEQISAGAYIRANGDIVAEREIRAGGSISANGVIKAGNGFGVFAGLGVAISEWQTDGKVSSHQKPRNLVSGYWKTKGD